MPDKQQHLGKIIELRDVIDDLCVINHRAHRARIEARDTEKKGEELTLDAFVKKEGDTNGCI